LEENNEIKILKELKNKNILSIEKYFQTEEINIYNEKIGFLNYVMEYCKDGDLRNYQNLNFKNENEIQKVNIILQILNGLDYVKIYYFLNI
jgi:serine/threonine protein kinase